MSMYEDLLNTIRESKMVSDSLEITPESDLRKDIGFDSMDAVELIMVIEEEFGVQFDTLIDYNTMQELADAIEARKNV